VSQARRIDFFFFEKKSKEFCEIEEELANFTYFAFLLSEAP